MGLVNRSIQYDQRFTEKPFLLNRHSPLVWDPSFNADRKNAALQHLSSSELRALDPVQRNLGQWNVALGEIPHQIVDAGRNHHGFERGAIPKAGGEGGGNRFHSRSID